MRHGTPSEEVMCVSGSVWKWSREAFVRWHIWCVRLVTTLHPDTVHWSPAAPAVIIADVSLRPELDLAAEPLEDHFLRVVQYVDGGQSILAIRFRSFLLLWRLSIDIRTHITFEKGWSILIDTACWSNLVLSLWSPLSVMQCVKQSARWRHHALKGWSSN